MEQKVFDIYKKDNNVKVQIGDDIIGLDNEERMRLLKLFKSIKDTKTPFPSGFEGACLMYPTGVIAANISVSKLHISGTKFLLFLYYQQPEKEGYISNSFLLSSVIIDKYIEALS